jgi:putative DNA primase/helicase
MESQQWMDFVVVCAMKCGIPESLLINHNFMNQLIEGMAFQLAKYRRQVIPEGEVWLNVRNGTLVIRSDGSVIPHEHSKDDLFFYCLNYSHDPQAECPQWDNFINRVLPAPDAQQLLGEYIGYILMPDHRLEKMLLLYGEGLNGKSVTLEVVESLLGSSNVSYLSLSDLSNDDVKRACIENKKLNVSHESGKDVNPNVLKQMTSGEPVLIRNLYRDPRMINNYGKLIAAFNILPRAENTLGFFRRLLILHYQVTIPREEIDRQLAAKLKGELSGILNWVLKTLPALMTRNGFSPSESCERALEQYRLQSDNVKLFLNEMCEPSEYSMLAKDIFDAYRSYCLSSSLKPLGKTRFYDRLESLGYPCEKYGNLRRFKLKVIEQ